MRPIETTFLLPALTAVFLVAGPVSCAAAQEEPTPPLVRPTTPQASPAPPPALLPLLRAAAYDPTERGPLLVVIPRPFVRFVSQKDAPLDTRRPSLSALAAATDTRLLPAGRMNVLVPRTMTVINTKPGKANPFSGLGAAEILPLLLASFTPAQWQQVGSTAGIGKADLSDDQVPLWSQMLPEEGSVEKYTLRPGEMPGSWRYTDPIQTPAHPRETGRLRLSKAVSFSFYKSGAKETSWGGDPYYGDTNKDGATVYQLSSLAQGLPGTLPNTVYGVPLLLEQPRRLKSGAVDFDAPRLDRSVALLDFPPRPAAPAAKPVSKAEAATPQQEFAQAREQARTDLAALPTVGALLARVTQVTGLEFVADRRVRDLPVYLRGDAARAGDLLQALCLSVGGAFRKMEPGDKQDTTLYLLTDDVEGIGTRAARLGEWGEAAEALKRRITDKADETTAKNDPLSFLSFAPDDPFALSKAQTKRTEDSWRAQRYGAAPDVLAADMTPALRQAVRKFADERAQEGITLSTDRVVMGETLKAFLVLPEAGGKAIEARELGDSIGHQYLQRIAFDPTRTAPTPPKSAAPTAPLGFTAQALRAQRRILLARPETEATAVQIVQAAIGRGITEVWLEISLADDPAAATRLLTKATAAGGTKIAVGGLVRLLKDNGSQTIGEPERNILGETGNEYRTRRLAGYSGDKNEIPYYQSSLLGFAGWRAVNPADAAELRRRVNLIAEVPNLAGLTFRATGAPGWLGKKQGGDGIWLNAAQGYTPTVRRAFLREYGIDPIDIPDVAWPLQSIQWNVGLFPENDGKGEYEVVNNAMVLRGGDVVPRAAWWEFRKRRNTGMLADFFKTVRGKHPHLPLYMDDRISSYTHANTDFFGSWDTPEGLPDFNPFTGEGETRSAARHTSKTVMEHGGWWWNADRANKPEAPASFARQVTTAAAQYPPPAWDGVVVDLSGVPGVAVAGLLQGLPKP